MGTATEIMERDAMATVAPYAPVTFHRRARVDLDDRLPKPCNENAFLLHPNCCQRTDLYMCIYYRLTCDISYIIIPQIWRGTIISHRLHISIFGFMCGVSVCNLCMWEYFWCSWSYRYSCQINNIDNKLQIIYNIHRV